MFVSPYKVKCFQALNRTGTLRRRKEPSTTRFIAKISQDGRARNISPLRRPVTKDNGKDTLNPIHNLIHQHFQTVI